jgi:ketosteroid isomerase-like protein
MSIAVNKEIVRQACQHVNDRDFPALLDLLHDDGTWTLPNRRDMFEYGGSNDKAGTEKLLNRNGGRLPIQVETHHLSVLEYRGPGGGVA